MSMSRLMLMRNLMAWPRVLQEPAARAVMKYQYQDDPAEHHLDGASVQNLQSWLPGNGAVYMARFTRLSSHMTAPVLDCFGHRQTRSKLPYWQHNI